MSNLADDLVEDTFLDDEKLELTPEELLRVDEQSKAEGVDEPGVPDLSEAEPEYVVEAVTFRGASGPYWPSLDKNSPDYRHLESLEASDDFILTPDDIEALISANRFAPRGHGNVITLAIRGSELVEPHQVVRQTSVALRNTRPDHKNFKCTVGFYYRDEGRITLFTGSTVPCAAYMEDYYHRMNGDRNRRYKGGCNLLPTGCYVFRVGAHSRGRIKPALRMSELGNLSQDAIVTVLRTSNDQVYGTQDKWDRTMPYDNVHCSYVTAYSSRFKAYFSSAGCLTVRGAKTPSHQWAKFQEVLNGLDQGRRSDLILLTGKDVAVVSKLRVEGRLADPSNPPPELLRLRPGSHGTEVRAMQRKLGFTGRSAYFGPSTKLRLATYQRSESIPSDGIYAPQLDQRLGWGVFS